MAIDNIQGNGNTVTSNINTTPSANTIDQKQLNQLLQQVVQLLLQLFPEVRDNLASSQTAQIEGSDAADADVRQEPITTKTLLDNPTQAASDVRQEPITTRSLLPNVEANAGIPEAARDVRQAPVTTVSSISDADIAQANAAQTRALATASNNNRQADTNTEDTVEASTSTRVINPTIVPQTTEADALGAIAANVEDPAAMIVANEQR